MITIYSPSHDEWDTKRMLNEIYARLGTESQEDKQCAQAMIDRIIRDFKKADERAKISLSLAGGRGAKEKLGNLRDPMTKAFERMSTYLDAGLGSATDTIVDNVNNPERPAREAERDRLINKGRQLVSGFGEWLDEFDAFIDGTDWKVEHGRPKIEMMRHGPPNRQLVRACWDLFQKFRPDEQSKGKDGDFHSVCRDIFGLATHEDARERLYDHVKTVVGLMQPAD